MQSQQRWVQGDPEEPQVWQPKANAAGVTPAPVDFTPAKRSPTSSPRLRNTMRLPRCNTTPQQKPRVAKETKEAGGRKQHRRISLIKAQGDGHSYTEQN